MTIKVAEEFSRRPGHRSPEDGEWSGEDFLSSVLEPAYTKALNDGEPLIVDLDGAAGYSTSFLEAAFGGLARMHSRENIQGHIKIISTIEPYLVDEVMLYIQEAAQSAEPTLT